MGLGAPRAPKARAARNAFPLKHFRSGWRYARSLIVQWLANGLLTDAEFLNDGFVAFGIRLPQVVEQAATLAHHHEKTAPGGMVLLMRLEMLRQFANPRAQDGDLDFRRTGIVIGSPVIGNQGGFFLSC